MKVKSESEKARIYLESHSSESQIIKKVGPCITVSRQSGSGSGIIDEFLKEILQKNQSEEYGEWAIFDRNLIEKILEDHQLPNRLGKLFREERKSSITYMMNELLGLQPSTYTLLHKTTQTILQLAQMGNVIIVGRAATAITSRLRNSFHVRLVAPIEDRIKRVMDFYHLGRKDALEKIRNDDISRMEYMRDNFHKDIDDPLLYHIVVNTCQLNYKEAANIIASAVMEKFPQMFQKREEVAVI
jgi:cytidylate kinase